MAARREREIARHTATKTRLENQYKARSAVVLSNEGISKTLVAILIAILNALLGLILAPEPLVTKVIALILAAGVSIFAVWAIYTVIKNGSLEDLEAQQSSYNEKEKEEDDRHDKALVEIGNN